MIGYYLPKHTLRQVGSKWTQVVELPPEESSERIRV